MNEDVVIEFNQKDLDQYLKDYFKKKPRCKKAPIESPMVRSLNKMLIITNRIVQNTHKQNWKEYTKWVVKKHNLENIGISKSNLHIELTFPTKTRRDIDNFVSKEVMDGLVEAGVLVDDSYFYVNSITTTARYEKGVIKMIFTFKDCEYDLVALKEAQEKELHRKLAKEETMANKPKKRKSKKK